MAGTAAATQTLHRSRGVVRIEVAITCDASGVMTAVVVGEAYGRLVAVAYNGGLDASAVITLADAGTGASISAFTTGTEGTPVYFRPVKGVSTNAGALVTAADTAPNTNRDIKVGGRLTVGVTSGGNAETGTIAYIFDESPHKALGELALTV